MFTTIGLAENVNLFFVNLIFHTFVIIAMHGGGCYSMSARKAITENLFYNRSTPFQLHNGNQTGTSGLLIMKIKPTICLRLSWRAELRHRCGFVITVGCDM